MPEFASRRLALWARSQAELGMGREALAAWAAQAGFAPSQVAEALDMAEAQGAFDARPDSLISGPGAGAWRLPGGIECRLWMKAPEIALFDGVVSPEQARAIERSAELRLAPSLVAGSAPTPARGRSSKSRSFEPGECAAADALRGRLASLLGVGLERLEKLQATRYDAGGFYAPHYDHFPEGHPRAGDGSQRVATFVVYLGEPESGGQTVIEPVGLSVAPKAGSALYFAYPDQSSRELCLHASAPCSGGKWIATQWVRAAHGI